MAKFDPTGKINPESRRAIDEWTQQLESFPPEMREATKLPGEFVPELLACLDGLEIVVPRSVPFDPDVGFHWPLKHVKTGHLEILLIYFSNQEQAPDDQIPVIVLSVFDKNAGTVGHEDTGEILAVASRGQMSLTGINGLLEGANCPSVNVNYIAPGDITFRSVVPGNKYILRLHEENRL